MGYRRVSGGPRAGAVLMRATCLAFALLAVLVTGGCSAMLIGDGRSSSPPLGSDDRDERTAAADATLAHSVRTALAADDAVAAANLGVSARAGVVVLSGEVSSFDLRDRALSLARRIEGVSRVDSQVRVKTR